MTALVRAGAGSGLSAAGRDKALGTTIPELPLRHLAETRGH